MNTILLCAQMTSSRLRASPQWARRKAPLAELLHSTMLQRILDGVENVRLSFSRFLSTRFKNLKPRRNLTRKPKEYSLLRFRSTQWQIWSENRRKKWTITVRTFIPRKLKWRHIERCGLHTEIAKQLRYKSTDAYKTLSSAMWRQWGVTLTDRVKITDFSSEI